MKEIKHLDWAAESYENGASLNHLASILNCQAQTLRNRLKKEGVEMRPRGRTGKKKKRFHKTSIEKIRAFLDQRSKGDSVDSVVDNLGVSRQAIYALFKAGSFVLPKEKKEDEPHAIDNSKAIEVMNLFMIHEDLHYVAYFLGMDIHEVREILKSKDIEVPHIGKERAIGCDQYREIFKMRQEGKTISEIADEYNVSLPTISNIIKDIEKLIEESI
jgi:DNA invertase Pin-like site-specific DNA recombinase